MSKENAIDDLTSDNSKIDNKNDIISLSTNSTIATNVIKETKENKIIEDQKTQEKLNLVERKEEIFSSIHFDKESVF